MHDKENNKKTAEESIESKPEIQEKEKNKKTKNKKSWLKNLIEWIIYIIIFVLIVWGTPRALVKILNTDYPIASITSGSMWPELKKGDLVLIKGVSTKEEIEVGDIVVFENNKGFTIHRVIRKYDNKFVTKGDANNVEDGPTNYDQLIGKTIEWKNGDPVKIPKIGFLSQILKK